MKVFIETYGCTYNQGDSQIMAGVLKDEGIELTNTMEDADVIIINTCYVKQPTESKVTNRIQKLQLDFPEKKVIVSGCMVEIDPNKLNKIAGENTSWIGPHKLNKTAEVVKSTFNGDVSRECGLSNDLKVGISKVRDDPLIHIIPICEGCLGACTYCCTRFARGKLQSYPISEIKKEAQKAIDEGCVEIQLTAQDTAAFGRDSGEKLSSLIKEVASLEGNFRVRVGMMHPKSVIYDLDETIEAFKLPNVYDFIHLPVQCGSNKVLHEMKRGHTIEKYCEIVSKFRSQIPNLTLATDIIVGYPTETEEDFNETVKFLKEIKPNLIHLSKYHHREGAISSSLDEIPYEEMKRRSKYLTNIKVEITEEENKHLLNKILSCLVVEEGSKGGFIAKSDSYIPVVINDVELGTFVNAKIYETTGTYLKGKQI